jgi:hypothetical protein
MARHIKISETSIMVLQDRPLASLMAPYCVWPGWAQVQAGTSDPSWGVSTNKFFAFLGIGGVAPYGDDPRDQLIISGGIKYYRNQK